MRSHALDKSSAAVKGDAARTSHVRPLAVCSSTTASTHRPGAGPIRSGVPNVTSEASSAWVRSRAAVNRAACTARRPTQEKSSSSRLADGTEQAAIERVSRIAADDDIVVKADGSGLLEIR